MQARSEAAQLAVAFRFELRSATRTEHRVLDEHPAFKSLADGSLGIAGYRQLMVLFHGLYAALDEPLAAASNKFVPRASAYVYVPRQAILASDLESLGVAGMNVPQASASYPSTASLCGALYVVEGSLLGGAMLQRATEALLAGHGGNGDGYWRWCRDVGGSRWAATCALIETNAQTPQARGEMVEAARRTFRQFSDWFAHWRTPYGLGAPALPSC